MGEGGGGVAMGDLEGGLRARPRMGVVGAGGSGLTGVVGLDAMMTVAMMVVCRCNVEDVVVYCRRFELSSCLEVIDSSMSRLLTCRRVVDSL